MLANDQDGAAARLGARIAERRRLAGLTQQQLADRAAVSVGTVRDLEQGRTARPRRDTAQTLARVLGLDLDRDLASDAASGPPGNGHKQPPRRTVVTGVAGVAGPGIRLGVLGPLALWRDGTAANPGAGRQRAVLGLLAMYSGTAVHREMIIDSVWGDRPPASAVPMVQTYASRLRRLLGGGLLVSDGTSYRLSVTADQLDALQFALLADQAGEAAAAGEPAVASSLYEQALRLWRGEPLADVSAMRGHPAVTDLTQQRAVAVQNYAVAAAAAGCPERALPQLRALAARDPLDERVHARLMLTLAACGQRAGALAVFGQVRRRLADELGVVPGAELMEAHLRILRDEFRPSGADGAQTGRQPEHDHAGGGDAAAAGAERAAPGPAVGRAGPGRAASPRQLPLAVAQFSGRASELVLLSSLADQAARSASTVVSVIAGMAGIGKTALAVHWAHQAAASFPDGQLFADLRGLSSSGTPAAPGEVIRGFLDALGVAPGQVPAGLNAEAALYRSLTAGRRMLIVLDNARDEQQVRPLLPGSPGSLVIVTSRNQLTGLAAAEGARLLTLDVLSGADARDLLAGRLGSFRAAAEPDAAAEIAALCGHLPLALAVTAARAASRPRFSLAALAAELRGTSGRLAALDIGDAAVSVRTVFSWSYAQLSPATARMFRLLGLHPGPDVNVPAAASLAGVPVSQARQALTELARAHLVTEPVPGRYGFHDLLRAYAAEQAQAGESDEARRAATHRTLDYYLHTAHAAARLLYPFREPASLDPPQPAVSRERLASHQQAQAWFQAEHKVLLASVTLAADSGFDRHAWQLPWALAEYLDQGGHWRDDAAVQDTAIAAAMRLEDTAGQAVAQRRAAFAWAGLAEYDHARDHLTSCLELCRRLGDQAAEARTHRMFSWVSGRQGRYADALGHAEQALALLRGAGDRAGEAGALNSVGWNHAMLGDYERARTFCRQARDLHREVGNRLGEAVACDSLGYAEHHLGRLREAAVRYQRALDIYHQADTLANLGDTYRAAGEHAAARGAWEQALGLLTGLGHPDAEQVRARLSAGS